VVGFAQSYTRSGRVEVVAVGLCVAALVAALGDGEGCLSVDRDVPGYVVRHARVTVEYFNKEGEKQRVKLRGYNSIVVQHEIDHTNGIMFYDRINKDNPFAIKDGLLIIE